MHTYKDAIIGSLGAYVLYPGDKNRIFPETPPNKLPSVGAFPLKPGGDDFNEEEIIEKFIKQVFDYINMILLK